MKISLSSTFSETDCVLFIHLVIKKRGCPEIGSHAFLIQLLSLFLLYSLTFHAFCKIIFADRYFEFFNC